MLDTIPNDFWKTPKKVFEPCCGKGGFVLDVIDRFDKGLKIPDEKERRRVILEECLYFADKNKKNIEIVKQLIDVLDEYKLNFYEGNTLELDIEKEFGLKEFDLVVSNPPFNLNQKKGSSTTLYPKFIIKGLELTKDYGYFLFLTPPGWRRPCVETSNTKGFFKLMTQDNRMMYLKMYSQKEGGKLFKCIVCFDYYLIKKETPQKPYTINIIDMKGEKQHILNNKFYFLPHFHFDLVQDVIRSPKQKTLYNTFYCTRKRKILKNDKDDEYRYPIVNKTGTKSKEILYSNVKNDDLFNVKKVIVSIRTGAALEPFIDLKGEYGFSRECIAYVVKTKKEAELIRDCFMKKSFRDFLRCFIYSTYAVDALIFQSLTDKFYLLF
jgi:hypothetical protein